MGNTQSLPIRFLLQVSFKHVVSWEQQTRIQYCTMRPFRLAAFHLELLQAILFIAV